MSGYASVFRPGLFTGQVVIVTGGGSGIGRCTAHELAALGATVALVGRKPEKLAAVQAEIEATGGKASSHPCDIREESVVAATVAEVLAQHGRIDGLVNNAGGQYPSPLRDIKAKGWDAVVRNNLTGGFLMARECYTQYMEAHGGGQGSAGPSQASLLPLGGADAAQRRPWGCSIVNIIADIWMGMPGMGHSGAARAGMLNFTETAALEWAPVRSNAVAPGWIASSGMDQYPPEMGPLIRNMARMTPACRMGSESEVAAAIVFLLSPAAAFISGACLRIDGGAPNAKRIWPQVGTGKSPAQFDGFHLATTPKVLSGENSNAKD